MLHEFKTEKRISEYLLRYLGVKIRKINIEFGSFFGDEDFLIAVETPIGDASEGINEGIKFMYSLYQNDDSFILLMERIKPGVGVLDWESFEVSGDFESPKAPTPALGTLINFYEKELKY